MELCSKTVCKTEPELRFIHWTNKLYLIVSAAKQYPRNRYNYGQNTHFFPSVFTTF